MNIQDYKLFTIGPAQMYQSTLDVRKHVVPYFRTPEFSNLMLDNKKLMIKLQKAEEGSEVVFCVIHMMLLSIQSMLRLLVPKKDYVLHLVCHL